MNNFIEIYDKSLKSSFCDNLIKKFENDKNKLPGAAGHRVDESVKKSTDIEISSLVDWRIETSLIANSTLSGLIQYVKKYPHLLIGGLKLKIDNKVVDLEYIKNSSDSTLSNLIKKIYRLGNINLQKYKKSSGHYDYFHSEIFPDINDSSESLHRVLLFMYYLNDVDNGGTTEFLYQKTKIKPKKGSLVIAPGSFTHTHKGNIPISNDKYILTSWVMFQKSNHLY